MTVADQYFEKEDVLAQLYVYDDGVVKGFEQVDGTELVKLYVDTFFQNEGIGHQLIEYAMQVFQIEYLWALEKNKRALGFYGKHGFMFSGEKKLEEDTTEYLLKLVRNTKELF